MSSRWGVGAVFLLLRSSWPVRDCTPFYPTPFPANVLTVERQQKETLAQCATYTRIKTTHNHVPLKHFVGSVAEIWGGGDAFKGYFIPAWPNQSHSRTGLHQGRPRSNL
ncbi:hypothetical protein CHARACLAT_011691 [Characodon lateralis]|uniref:Secreted protein n=1 Tax=Characodon lateralis TaxID=208331 RepID=A0ABU7CZR1_9TELE|nr:hypothetical protein [Characodon lateralis]